MARAVRLTAFDETKPSTVTFGVCATCDPHIDAEARKRATNIVGMVADVIAKNVTPAQRQSGQRGLVRRAHRRREAGRHGRAAVQGGWRKGRRLAPDTWAFPQLTFISLLAQLPAEIPVNITCGNSGPKPGVVFAHAVNGAGPERANGGPERRHLGRYGHQARDVRLDREGPDRLVLRGPDRRGLRGRRVVVFGHDSMGMETALAHVIPTRRTFGLEITRLDMKLLADMLPRRPTTQEARRLRALGDQAHRRPPGARQRHTEEMFQQGLATYMIMRNLLADLNAVGGGFMNQLEWGSDRRGIPLPIADLAESLLNSTFDHKGRKAAVPFATEADTQGLLTMLFTTWLSGGNPPLFMDFRKVWEPWEIQGLADKLGVTYSDKDLWARAGIVDGDNSGSASLNWAAMPGDSAEEALANVKLPRAELYYFPGGGNSVTFISPGGIEGIASRMAYSELSGTFSFFWDEACTVALPEKLSLAVASTSNITWPHTYVVPKYATMAEYKQYAPANHFHMTWNLRPARLQYWMDMTNVLSVAPWMERPAFIPGVDRPQPLLHLLNGGENATKLRLIGK